MKTHLRFLATMGLALAFMASAGCAKKAKPDLGINAGVSKDTIQDKDMNFDVSGSDSGKIEGLYTVHFDYDKSSLTEESRGFLVKDANWLKKHDDKSLQVEGHCDNHGSVEYNLALGQRRAETVKKYLVNLGLSRDRISTISYGKERLFNTADNEAADAQNRRANFKPIDSPKINHLSQM
jgi:peptidoglycan-associated lipoprotein